MCPRHPALSGDHCSYACLLTPGAACYSCCCPPRQTPDAQGQGAMTTWSRSQNSGHTGASSCAQTPQHNFPRCQGQSLNSSSRASGLPTIFPRPTSAASSYTAPFHTPLLPPHLPTHPSPGSADFSEPCIGCPNSAPVTDHVPMIRATGWRGRADVDRSLPMSG